MKTTLHETINGRVARVPNFLRDPRRTMRRVRRALGRRLVVLATGRGAVVYAGADSYAAHVHRTRLEAIVNTSTP